MIFRAQLIDYNLDFRVGASISQTRRATLIKSVLPPMPFYTFACFSVLESICDKRDATIRNFQWGHDSGTRKVHLVGWDKICKAKEKGGLGFKKFSTLNQAMLAKQYWRIQNRPESLLLRTYRAKYFPRNSLKDYKPKPQNSWTWRSITKSKCADLQQGRWLVRSGQQIPLTHPDWFQTSNQKLREHNLLNGRVADLIDSNSRSQKCDLIRKIYPYPTSVEILKTSITKTVGNWISWCGNIQAQGSIGSIGLVL